MLYPDWNISSVDSVKNPIQAQVRIYSLDGRVFDAVRQRACMRKLSARNSSSISFNVRVAGSSSTRMLYLNSNSSLSSALRKAENLYVYCIRPAAFDKCALIRSLDLSICSFNQQIGQRAVFRVACEREWRLSPPGRSFTSVQKSSNARSVVLVLALWLDCISGRG